MNRTESVDHGGVRVVFSTAGRRPAAAVVAPVPRIVREPRFIWLNVRVGVNLILWGIARRSSWPTRWGPMPTPCSPCPGVFVVGHAARLYAFAFTFYSISRPTRTSPWDPRNTSGSPSPRTSICLSRRGHQRLLAPMAHHAVDLASRYHYIPLGGSRRGELRNVLSTCSSRW